MNKTGKTILESARGPKSTVSIRPLSCGFFLVLVLFAHTISAQGDVPDIVPPPLKLISKNEQARLAAQSHDIRNRNKLTLQLMGRRLSTAEDLRQSGDYNSMYSELGGFHGLMDDALQYLKTQNSRNRRVLDTFKRFEIGLRGFAPRLEVIRRELPLRYEDYVRRLIKYVRVARTIATEPLFGDTVIPERKPQP